MTVKSAKRILEILEHFEATRAPASLTDLARALALPKSSCLALIGTLEERGYLYQVHPRVGYDPTGRWLEQAQVVAEHDPVIHRIGPSMADLRSRTGETVILGKRVGSRVLYIAVVESRQTIRYTAHPGQFKPLYGTASGKALLGSLDAKRRRATIRELPLKAFTPRTVTAIGAIERDVERGAERGWHYSIGEHIPDVTAIAAVFELYDPYVLVVAGPTHRLSGRLESVGGDVVQVCRGIEATANPSRCVQRRRGC